MCVRGFIMILGTETISLHSINWLAFAMQTKCVCCEIGKCIVY